jgi:hypothetical protein
VSPKLRNSLIIGYALGALVTFGPSWHAEHRQIAEVNPNKGQQDEGGVSDILNQTPRVDVFEIVNPWCHYEQIRWFAHRRHDARYRHLASILQDAIDEARIEIYGYMP